MKLTRDRWLRAAKSVTLCIYAIALLSMAHAQAVSTTTVQGTVYLANGQPGSGTLQLSWPAFTTAANQAIAAGRTTAAIGADGFVSVNLAPNLGSSPAGLFYTAVYHMTDGTTSTEYWVVPAAAQATIAQVRAQVMPAAQALQAVNKAYVDQAIQSATQSGLSPIGGTLTGPLYLSGDPTQTMQAADKHYVDTAFSQAVPLTGAQPTGPLTACSSARPTRSTSFPARTSAPSSRPASAPSIPLTAAPATPVTSPAASPWARTSPSPPPTLPSCFPAPPSPPPASSSSPPEPEMSPSADAPCAAQATPAATRAELCSSTPAQPPCFR